MVTVDFEKAFKFFKALTVLDECNRIVAHVRWCPGTVGDHLKAIQPILAMLPHRGVDVTEVLVVARVADSVLGWKYRIVRQKGKRKPVIVEAGLVG